MFSADQMKEIEGIVRRVMTAPKSVVPKVRTSSSSSSAAAAAAMATKVKMGKYAFQSDDPEVVQYFNKIACTAESVIPKKPKDFFELSDENARVFIAKTLRTLVAHGCFDAYAKFVALFAHDALAFTLCGKSPFTDVQRAALLAFVGNTNCFARRGKMIEALSEPAVFEGLKEASEAVEDIEYAHTLEVPEKSAKKASKPKASAAAAAAAADEVESEVEFEPAGAAEDDADDADEAEDEADDVQATGVFDGFLAAPESPDRLSLGLEEVESDESVVADDADDSAPVAPAAPAAPVAPAAPAAPAALLMVPTRVTGVPVSGPVVVPSASEFKRAAPESSSSSSGVAAEPPTKRVCAEAGSLRKWEPMDVNPAGRVVVRGEEMSYEKWRTLPGDNNKYERYTRAGGEWMDVMQYYREYLKALNPEKDVDALPPVQLKVRYNLRK
jgi:hypothetical protein